MAVMMTLTWPGPVSAGLVAVIGVGELTVKPVAADVAEVERVGPGEAVPVM